MKKQYQILHADMMQLKKELEQIEREISDSYEKAQKIVRYLGAHYQAGKSTFFFWTPEFLDKNIASENVFLEIYIPQTQIDFKQKQQCLLFDKQLFSPLRWGEYTFCIIEGLTPGNEKAAGCFYWLKYQDHDKQWHTVYDIFANSTPFGSFAPAELYNMQEMFENRQDKAYFTQKPSEPTHPNNILQIHVPTASQAGTIQGLDQIYQQITYKIKHKIRLQEAEKHYIGYKALQLMPEIPTIEYENKVAFWQEAASEQTDLSPVQITLNAPDMTNWGYDNLIAGSCTFNPVHLSTKRPFEFLALIETLHNFPGEPIEIILDIVYGHVDNQALDLLNKNFIIGPNMYGQDLNYRHPMVRAVLLEMLRRKMDYGIDGLRVDGAQDFKYWDAQKEMLCYDDDFFQEMSALKLRINDRDYSCWMIYEDGRPWPRDDWELTSTYRAIIEDQPAIFQWGPLTFAHNTPFLYTFWVNKLWRIKEIMERGSNWITGCSNHDTLRRGSQVSIDSRINTELGNSFPEIIENTYDNAAEKLFTYGFLPGVPMDFINAALRTPWGFLRNTDWKYGIKVISEEFQFLDWRVTESAFQSGSNFQRLKKLGFCELSLLKKFMQTLHHAVIITDYHIERMLNIITANLPQLEKKKINQQWLQSVYRAWMDDMHDFCNVSLYWERQDPIKSDFNLKLREFRKAYPWLQKNLTPLDHFDYRYPTRGTVLFYGNRQSPDQMVQIFFAANMEGNEIKINLNDLFQNFSRDKELDRCLLSCHCSGSIKNDRTISLKNGEGFLFSQKK